MKSLIKFPPKLIVSVLAVFLIIFVGSQSGAFPSILSLSGNDSGSVLSSDEERDEGEDEGDEDEEDEDESDDNEDERDDDENEAEENEDEDEEEYESEDNETESVETKTTETVTNPNGTTSEIRREAKGGESKVQIRTFNQAGQKIQERVLEEKEDESKFSVQTFDAQGNKLIDQVVEKKDGEGEKSRERTFDALGNTLQDIELETETGRKLSLKIKESEGVVSKVKFDVQDQELLISSEGEGSAPEDESTGKSEISVRAKGESFVVRRSGIGVDVNFPMTIDSATGQIVIHTRHGDVVLGAMPDTIIQKVNASEEVDSVTGLDLQEGEDGLPESSALEMVIRARTRERLLGIFSLEVPTELIYDAESGEYLRTDSSFSSRLLQLLSF